MTNFKKILEQIQKFGRSRAIHVRSWIVVRIGPLSFCCCLWWLRSLSIYGGCYLCVVGVVLLQAAWRLSPSKPTLANLLPGLGGTPGGSAEGAGGGGRWPPRPFSCFGSLGPPPSRGFQIGEPRKKWKIMGFRVQRECQRRISLQRDHFRDGPKIRPGISM